MRGSLAALLLVACTRSGGSADAGPPLEIAKPTRGPSPANARPDFEVDDEVVFVREDGTFEVEATVLEVGAPSQGYRIRSGSGRFTKTDWVPGPRIFPAPWLGTVKVGDSFYERRFGNFTPPKCVVAAAPGSSHASVTARCEGDDRARTVKRQDMVAVFRAPSPGELKPGDVVYFKQMYWAIVIGTEGDRVVIRESGFASPDKAVLLSSLQAVR